MNFFSLAAIVMLSTTVAQAGTRNIPTCQSLNQPTLLNAVSYAGNWGEPKCMGVDEVTSSYVVKNYVMTIRRANGAKCVVLKGEYVWGCRSSN